MGFSLKPAPSNRVIAAHTQLSTADPELLRALAYRLEALANWTVDEHEEFFKQDSPNRRTTPGLCWYIDKFLRGLDRNSRALSPTLWLMESWPEFSGAPGYPVPAPDLPISEHVEYDQALTEMHLTSDDYSLAEWLWDMAEGHARWEGEYGDNRRRLTRFIATELRKIADEQEAAPATA